MIIYNENQLAEALQYILKQEYIFYDIETSALKHWQGNIIGIGISSFSRGYYVPIMRYDVPTDSLELLPGAQALAAALLGSLKGKKICAFNGAFDLPWTNHKLGYDLLPDYHADILLLKHTVDEEFPFKLKEIAVQCFGYGAAAEQRDLQAQLKARGATKHEIYKADVELIAKYCIQDCLLTARLFRYYEPKLLEQGLGDFFYKDEVMPLYKEVTIPMEQHGIKLDLPLMHTMLKEIKVDIEALEKSIQAQIAPLLGAVFTPWFLGKDYKPARTGNFGQGIARCYGMDALLPLTNSGKVSLAKAAVEELPEGHIKQVLLGNEELSAEEVLEVQQHMAAYEHGKSASLFNLQSKHHLKKLFFDTLGLEPLSRTELGNPQVDDDFIATITDKYAWAKDLQTYNRLQKIRATYIERFLDGQHEGIFYPSFFQHRTVSGRLAGDLQQLPRPLEPGQDLEVVTKYVNAIRSFFITRPGTVFVDADYNSAEPRAFASISGDDRLKDIFRSGKDFYSEIAIRTEKLQGVTSLKKADNYLGKVDPVKRQTAKAYALGCPYGLTGYKLQFQLGCTQEQGEKLVLDYLNAFPELKAWMENTQKFVLANGYMKCLGGRIRHMPQAKEYYDKYGLEILDSLTLYKKYGGEPHLYEQMKKIRKQLKNYINNANNVQVQGAVASVINRASIAIAREFLAGGLKAQIVAQIHDQLIVECLEDQKEVVAEIIQRNMESASIFDVPLPAQPGFGPNFKESKGA